MDNNSDPLCRTCTHGQSEHRDGRGACSHVETSGFQWGASDIICTCYWFLPEARPAAWVLDVLVDDCWQELDMHVFSSMQEAEAFALAEAGCPYGVRRARPR